MKIKVKDLTIYQIEKICNKYKHYCEKCPLITHVCMFGPGLRSDELEKTINIDIK